MFSSMVHESCVHIETHSDNLCCVYMLFFRACSAYLELVVWGPVVWWLRSSFPFTRTRDSNPQTAFEGEADNFLVAVDPPAKSLTFWGFSGNPLDFPKS